MSHAGNYSCQITLTSTLLQDPIITTSKTHTLKLQMTPIEQVSQEASILVASTIADTNKTTNPLARIKSDISKLQQQFNDTVTRTFYTISEKNVSVSCFRVYLITLPIEHREVHKEFFEKIHSKISNDLSVEAVWFRLSTYWNFLNYYLLEHVVNQFGGDDLKISMHEYKKNLKDFRCRTRLCDFAKFSTRINKNLTEQDLKDFVIKLNEHWDQCTLEDLERLTENITQQFFFPSFVMTLKDIKPVMTLKDIKPGSMVVTWAIPTMFAMSLKEKIENTENTNMREFFKTHGITSITMGSEECNYSPILKYSAYLKDLYSQMEGRNLAPFKLARIEKTNRSEFTKSTLRRNKDDATYCKHHMEEKEIGLPYLPNNKQPRLILIEGASGVGKTTFSEQFCSKWSHSELLSNHELLVLLSLQDYRVRSAKNISDLFQHPHFQQAISEEVVNSQGEGVALWLESWDKLEKVKREESSLFVDLVYSHVLPKATIIITSRPWATENIRKIVDQHIEIVSTPINIQVLQGDMIGADTKAKFTEYVNFNPFTKAAMHTPVTANIVTEVFQWSKDVESPPPTTMTQLYTAFTCKLLMQHLSSQKAEGKQSWKVQSLEEVPVSLRKTFLNLCRLAWEGIVEQELTYSSNAVGGNTLGLMHVVKEKEDSQILYHFIHQTLQEFLSSYHITLLPQQKQEQIIRDHIKMGHLNMVVTFYFGLTNPNTFTSILMSEELLKKGSATAFHWLFETDLETISKLLEEERVEVQSSHAWRPVDYYVLGHAIAHLQYQWNLIFLTASMGDEGIEMLCKGISSAAETTWNGEITTADFFGNHITSEGVKCLVNIPPQILQQIKKLDMGGNDLDRDTLGVFSEGISKLTNLQSLSLDNNPIGNGGAVEVLKCLHHYKTPLKELNLRNTKVGEEDGEHLALLIADTDLETLCISGGLLSSIMKHSPPYSTLQTLNMSVSCLFEEDIVSLSSFLQQSLWQLRKLDISMCHTTTLDAMQLATALTHNNSLHVLYMGGNSIGPDGAKALSKAITENKTLQELDLYDDDSLGDVGIKWILSSLMKNTTLCHLNLSRKYECPSDPRVLWCSDTASKSLTFFIPSDHTGLVIGKDGKNILEVERATNTIIKLDPQPGLTGKTVGMITGSEENCKRAALMIDQKLSHKVSMHTAASDTIKVADNMAGRIIGKNGITVATIKSLSGAQEIKISDRPTGLEALLNPERDCTITGSHDQIEEAKKLIQRVIEGEDIVTNARVAAVMTKLGFSFGSEESNCVLS